MRGRRPSLSAKASQADRDYIAALTKRYAKDPKTDRKALAEAYKNAMGELAKNFPDDLDAATLYAESMMNLRPWRLWTLDGKPVEDTLEIVAVRGLHPVAPEDGDHRPRSVEGGTGAVGGAASG